MVKLLVKMHKKAKAVVCINGILSNTINCNKGVRLGCPLKGQFDVQGMMVISPKGFLSLFFGENRRVVSCVWPSFLSKTATCTCSFVVIIHID